MSLDTGGNARIDFAWGNVPMQPNDFRANGMGENLSPSGVARSSTTGFDGVQYSDVVYFTVPDIINFVPGENLTVSGFENTYMNTGCGAHTYNFGNLNGTYQILRADAGGYGGSGVGANAPVAGNHVPGYVYVKLDWYAVNIGQWQSSWGSDPGNVNYYWGATNSKNARVSHAGYVNVGGTSQEEDKFWSHTNAKESADLTADNDPFWSITQGYAGYPGYLPNDSDNVPGGVLVPNVIGLKYEFDPSTEPAPTGPYAKDTLEAAGFSATRVNTIAGAVNAGDQWGDFLGFSTLAGNRYVQFYGREGDASSKVPAIGTPVAFQFNGCNAYNVPNDIRNVISNYLDQPLFKVRSRSNSGRDWYDVEPIAGLAGEQMFEELAALGYTNWGNWQGQGAAGTSWTSNIGLVASTTPKNGLTAEAGSLVTVTTYSGAQHGIVGQVYQGNSTTSMYTDLTDKVGFYLNDGCGTFSNGDTVTISGMTMLNGCGSEENGWQQIAFDGSAFNGTYTVIEANSWSPTIWVDAVWSAKVPTNYTKDYASPGFTESTWVRN